VERERVHAEGRGRHTVDPRRAADDAHLVADVGQPLTVPVMLVEGFAVRGAQEALLRLLRATNR